MNRTTTPSVPVIIPVYGRDDVFATVEMLRAQAYAAAIRFIVIDNGNGPELAAENDALYYEFADWLGTWEM